MDPNSSTLAARLADKPNGVVILRDGTKLEGTIILAESGTATVVCTTAPDSHAHKNWIVDLTECIAIGQA